MGGIFGRPALRHYCQSLQSRRARDACVRTARPGMSASTRCLSALNGSSERARLRNANAAAKEELETLIADAGLSGLKFVALDSL
jgi:hypothetical protein